MEFLVIFHAERKIDNFQSWFFPPARFVEIIIF